ncbi:hypothetical protein BGY98DRAFT_940724 [Russula aff. rugulosa BPL654]|nr:hypothetical protein BGY98DRAFT_940724 [Russula aff. rugulosa BPL654]
MERGWYRLQPLCGQGDVCPLGWSLGGPRNNKGKRYPAVAVARTEVPSNPSPRCPWKVQSMEPLPLVVRRTPRACVIIITGPPPTRFGLAPFFTNSNPHTTISHDGDWYIPSPHGGHAAALVDDVMYSVNRTTDLSGLTAFRRSTQWASDVSCRTSKVTPLTQNGIRGLAYMAHGQWLWQAPQDSREWQQGRGSGGGGKGTAAEAEAVEVRG